MSADTGFCIVSRVMALSLLVGILAIVTAERTNIIAGEGGAQRNTKYRYENAGIRVMR